RRADARSVAPPCWSPPSTWRACRGRWTPSSPTSEDTGAAISRRGSTGSCSVSAYYMGATLQGGHEMSDGDAPDTPVLDTLALMTAASVESCELSPRELMLVRLTALVAVDAPPASYLANTGVAV